MMLVVLAAMTVYADGVSPRRIFNETPEQKAERLSWWTHDRFGMFIHFGLYAIPARGEWVKKSETIPEAKYDEYFKTFNPDLFDAKAWAKAAKRAGMKYVVLTTKHHEGFCLWDSKYTDYKITNTPFGRDLVKEFCEAVTAEGLHVGFYYSLIDWNHPHFTIDSKHPRRPKWAEDWGHYGDSEQDYPELNKNRDMAKYRQYMKDQLRELLTNYGKVDILWMDFSYPGEQGKDPADWDSEGLLRLARSLQPQVIVNNRMGLTDTADGWDFVTPEQFKVREWPTVGGQRVQWETCQTFSGSWGYARDQHSWKSPEELISLLVETVSKGGNLIMNVGPTARGKFDARALSRLDDYAKWMEVNSPSIYGCTEAPSEFVAPENTVLTYNPATNRLYIHLLAYPGVRLACPFVDRVACARFLHDGSEIQLERHGAQAHHVKTFYKTGCEGVSYFKLPALKPDVVNPVIEVILKEKPDSACANSGHLLMRLLSPSLVGEGMVGNYSFEETLDRNSKDSVDEKLLSPTVEDHRSAFRVVLPECAESGEIFGFDFGRVLHFDGDKLSRCIDDEVHFRPAASTPEIESISLTGIVEPGAEMLVYETFERHAVDFLRPVERPLWSQCAEHSGVEEVEFLMGNYGTFRSLGEYGKAACHEHFLKYLEVGVHSRTFDAGLPCDGACGQHRAMRKGRGFEEAGKRVEFADNAFVDDFLLKIEVEIGLEHGFRGLFDGVANKRYHPKSERVIELEVISHFGSDERVAKAFDSTSAEKVGVLGTFQLSRARTCQNEAEIAPFFYQVVNCVEQHRDTLDFVNDEGLAVGVCVNDVNKAFRPCRKGTANIRFEQVDAESVRKLAIEPDRLACAAWSEKEETSVGIPYKALFHGVYNTISAGAMQCQSSIADRKNALVFLLATEKCDLLKRAA